MNIRQWLAAALLLAASLALGCEEDFQPASVIDTERFLAVVADPLEIGPGETITFSSLITEEDGSLYNGPVAWAILTNDMLRESSQANIDPDDAYLQMPGQPSFSWTAPDLDELTRKFGAAERDGFLATVVATGFRDGDPNGQSFSAFKLFVISTKPPAQRIANPTLTALNVIAGGGPLTPDAEGRYEVPGRKATLAATPGEGEQSLTYHWFATLKDFEPDLGARQDFKPEKRGTFTVFCVLRESYYFYHDAHSKTRVTGEDWGRAVLVFN
jgi:hypothetical protein